MRLIGAFLCFFLLILLGGTVSYIYLMWTNYWLRVQTMDAQYRAQQLYRVNYKELSGGKPRGVPRKISDKVADPTPVRQSQTNPQRPKFSGPYQKGADVVTVKPKRNLTQDLPKDKLLAHLKVYKDQIYSQLRNAVIETGKQVQSETFPNAYNVSYKGSLGRFLQTKLSPQQILCDAKEKMKIETFTRGNELFQKLQLDRFFPENELLKNRNFNTCAVVTSAGSLKNSNLGSFIDTHDIVLRFNNAPTDKYAKDVGTKTSLRIVNSQVVAKPQFKFLESPVYSKSAVLVWDPSSYNATLQQWYSRPDWPFFEQFFSKRLMQPDDPLFLIHPASLWSLWNWLQSHTKWPLLPTPPSSGFLGTILLLQHCATVHIFEYIPSMRLTKRCHYYDTEDNLGCTLGDWHPLAAEKLIALALHTEDDVQMLKDGYITIPGFSSCPAT